MLPFPSWSQLVADRALLYPPAGGTERPARSAPSLRFRTGRSGLLLAYLALFPDRSHSREELLELLWPDAELEAGRLNLRVALTSLRRQLEPPGVAQGSVLLTDRRFVGLNSAAFDTDVARFEAALQAAAQAPSAAQRAQVLSQALELYRGELLPGYYEEWVLAERQRLAGRFQEALRQLVLAHEEAGQLEDALACARRAVAQDPLQEESRQDLMRLCIATGRPTEVLRHFREWERLLEAQLGVKPSAQTQALLAEWLQQTAKPVLAAPKAAEPVARADTHSSVAAAPSSLPASSRLPKPLTRFFGRQEEIARLRVLLELATEREGASPVRLVTLLGPGGCGKTRLALEIGWSLVEAYAGAVCFVSLVDLADTCQIASAILQALNLSPSPGCDPLQILAEFLRQQPWLLILDNFEHLVEEGAQSVAALLEQAPDLRCLVTSRQLLGLLGEHEMSVPPLAIPPPDSTPEQLVTYPGVQLFVDRAQAVLPDFQVTSANAADIARLSERLEGIPLAIELTATWSKLLSPAQMLAQLQHRFEFLVSRRKNLSVRHRSLRATLDWSYGLLAPELQRFFVRLSIFRGGWTLEAAEVVCQEPTALEALLQLQEHSLVLTDEATEARRFHMLETLREYAQEQLSQEERTDLSRRHLDYFMKLAEEAEPQLKGLEQTVWLERLEEEHANLRSALDWCLEEENREQGTGKSGDEERADQSRIENRKSKIQKGLRLAGALQWFWKVRGHLSEGRVYLTEALNREGAVGQTQVRAKALYGAGNLAHDQGDYAPARALLEESLAIFRALGHKRGIAISLDTLGLIASDQGDYDSARALHEQSLALKRELGDNHGIAGSLNNLGKVASRQGDYEKARALYEQALSINRESGNRVWEAKNLGNLGIVAADQGDYASARALFEEGLALSRELGDKLGIAFSLTCLGNVANQQGDYGAARALYEESLAIYRELGSKDSIGLLLGNVGNASYHQGDYETARALHEQALSINRESGNRVSEAINLNNLGAVAQAQGDYARAWALYEESLAIRGELGDKSGIASSLSNLGAVAHDQGDYEVAATLHEQSLAIKRELGDQRGIAHSLYGLGSVMHKHGDYGSAKALYKESLAIRGELGDKSGIASSLETFACLALAEGQSERAARLWGAENALRQAIGSPLPLNVREEYNRDLAAVQRAMGQEAFAAAWAQGRAMTIEQATAYALEATEPPQNERLG